MVCPTGKAVTLVGSGNALYEILTWLNMTAFPEELFEINGSPEWQGCDLRRFGEAPVSLN